MPCLRAHELPCRVLLCALGVLLAACVHGVAQDGPATPIVRKSLALLDGEPGPGRWLGMSLTPVDDAEERLQDFRWEQKKGPPPEHVIPVPERARLWVLLWKPADYTFELRAKNKKGENYFGRLRFFVEKEKPALTLDEALRKAGAGELIALPGEDWQQVNGPRVRLRTNQDGWESTFRPLKAGLYLFEALRAGDEAERRAILVPTGKDRVMGNRRPYAELPTFIAGMVDRPVVVDGSLSTDPDNPRRPLDAIWSGDIGDRGLKLRKKSGLKATFVASQKGVYRVRLIVSDGSLSSTPVETFLRIRAEGEALPDLPEDDYSAPPDPLQTKATVYLYESNLDRAIQVFPSRCKTTLRVAMVVGRPETFTDIPLHLGVSNTPVRVLMDWIAMQTRLAYRLESDRSLWLTRPGAWWKEEKLHSEVLSVDALYEEPDGSDLLSMLKHVFRGVLKNRRETSLSIDPKSQKILAVMPKSACVRLKSILMHLRAPEGLGLPPPPMPTGRRLALRRKLATEKITVDWRNRRLDLVIRDLASRSGFASGFDPKAFPEKLPRVTLKLKKVRLRQALRDLVAAAGFSGCQAREEGALWFYCGSEPYPSGELIWDVAYVRAYPVKHLLTRLPLLSGELIAHHVRRRVYSKSWKDPAASCVYHAPTGKIVITHGPLAHDAAVTCLNDLLARGMSAFGPAVGGDEKK